MSTFAFLKEVAGKVDWSLVGGVGLDAICLALAFWIGNPEAKVEPLAERPLVMLPPTAKTPAAPRARRFHNVCDESTSRPRKKLFEILSKVAVKTSPKSLDTELPVDPLVVKKKKSVAFAEWKNQVLLVESWIDRRVHVHKKLRDGAGTVEFACEFVYPDLERWIEPDGHNQINFPRTKWIRGVPDPTLEDCDGDIEMLDC